MTSDRGFTLVELLAAMVAGALLLASISWIVGRLGQELHDNGEHQLDAQIADIAPSLRTMLSQATPAGKEGSSFEGKLHGLSALVPSPMALGSVGPVTLDLDVRPTRRGQALFARVSPHGTAGNAPPSPDGEMLVDGMDDIHFDYVARPANDPVGLPLLITIRFSKGADSAALAIAPRVTSDGRCHFDPISMTCRA
jgi:prepilin-type N-terminal cleavage/methylation domain-containing protein